MNNYLEISCKINYMESENLFYVNFENGEIVLNDKSEIEGFDIDLDFVKSLGIELDEFESIKNDVKISIIDLIKKYKEFYY